jgi:hypothetical protein
MERDLWPLLYRLVRSVAKDFHQKNVAYQPWLVPLNRSHVVLL